MAQLMPKDCQPSREEAAKSLLAARNKFESMPSLHVSPMSDEETGSPPNVPDFIDFVTQQTLNLRNCLPPLDEDDGLAMHKLVKAQSLQNVQQAPPGDATYKMHRGRGGGNPGKVRAHWPMSSQNFPQIDFPPNAKVRTVLGKQRNIAAQPTDHREYMITHRSPHQRSPYSPAPDRSGPHPPSDKNQVYSPHAGPIVANKPGAGNPYPSRGVRYQTAPNSAQMTASPYREQYPVQQRKIKQPSQQSSTQNGHAHTQQQQLGGTGSSEQLNSAHSGRSGTRTEYQDGRGTQDYSEPEADKRPTMGVVVNVYPKDGQDPVVDAESTGVIPKIWDALHVADILNGLEKFSGRPASEPEINLVHENELLDTPEHTKQKEDAITAAGCVMEMAYKIIEKQFMCGAAVVRPSGHLIARDNDETEYRLNNVAIAAANCVHRGHFQRVAILNWDARYSSGAESIFYDDDRVLVISMFKVMQLNSKSTLTGSIDECGEGGGLGTNVNIPWPSEVEGVGDPEYLAAMRSIVVPILHAFKPGLLFVQAGFTAAVGDTLGMRVTPAGFGQMTNMLKAVAGGKIILALEGGSNVESVVECIVSCASVLSDESLPRLPDSAVAAVPLRSCSAMLQKVIDVQSKYYPTLERMRDLTNISLREVLRLDERDIQEAREVETAPPPRSNRELDQRVESAAQALAELSFARGAPQPANMSSPQMIQPANTQANNSQAHYGSEEQLQHAHYTSQPIQPQPQSQHRQHPSTSRQRPHEPMYAQEAYTHAHKRPTHNQPISAKTQRQTSQPVPGERSRYQPSPKMKGVNREHIDRDRGFHGNSSHLHAGAHAYQPYDHPSHPIRSRSPDVIKKKKKKSAPK